MAITFQAVGNFNETGTTATGISVPKPAPAGGLLVDDLLLVFVKSRNAISAIPAPWGAAWITADSVKFNVWYRFVDDPATEAASWFWTQSAGVGRIEGTCCCYRGVDRTDPFCEAGPGDGYVLNTAQGVASTIVGPAITTDADNAKLVRAHFCTTGSDAIAPAISLPAGFTSRANNNSGNFGRQDARIADADAGAAGTYGPSNSTLANDGSTTRQGLVIALNPLVAVPPTGSSGWGISM